MIIKSSGAILFFAYIILISCGKKNDTVSPPVNTNPGTDPGTTLAGSAGALKTQVAVSYKQNSTSVNDSVIVDFGYDTQNRLTFTKQHQWDISSGTTIVENNSVLYTYSKNGNTINTISFVNGSGSPSVQYIYYMNSGGYVDSSAQQSYINSSWHTTKTNSYTYNTSGYVSTFVESAYDSTTGNLKNVVSHFLSWSNGDNTVDSIVSGGVTNTVIKSTYDGNVPIGAANTSVFSSGPYNSPMTSFKGQNSAHVLKRQVNTIYLNGGIPLSGGIDFSYALDSNNKIKTLTITADGQTRPSVTMFFYYY